MPGNKEANVSRSTIRGKCDICNRRDGFNNLNLQECADCGIKVHETCYGKTKTDCKDANWLCHACKAVGTVVVVSKPDAEKVVTITQEERPGACALCPIKTGPHAMHPLYDVHGKEGRQVVNKKKQLVWVHSLCAMYHTTHTGYVYGTDDDGNFYEEDEGTAADGNANGNNDEKRATAITADTATAAVDTARFIIGGKEEGQHEDYAKQTRMNIIDARKDSCFVCNKKDNVHGILRIPVECSAGSKDEPHQLAERRVNPDERCTRTVHVGCARWGLNSKTKKPYKNRRLFYHPGLQRNPDSNDDLEQSKIDPCVACYCNKHAKEIHESKERKKKAKEREEKKRKRRIIEEEEEEEDAMDEGESTTDNGAGNERIVSLSTDAEDLGLLNVERRRDE